MNGTIGEIRLFGGNFAPRAWAYCSGQLLSIAQNTALFSILGTTYGGDGRTTFALPDLRGRVAVQAGTGPGLSTRKLGQRTGLEYVNLNALQIPSHTHTGTAGPWAVSTVVISSDDLGTASDPEGNLPAETTSGYMYGSVKSSSGKKMAGDILSLSGPQTTSVQLANTGASQAHNNMQPYLTLNYIICLMGTFPSRS
ncbi:MAG: tail fiber protein [Cytophagales bacterium]|nr:tail fiber protein [Cytophagales bacterium]